MGLLFYDNPPNDQILLNGSFEQELGSTWRTFLDAKRSDEISLGGNFSVKLSSNGSSIVQEGAHLILQGTNTFSMLLQGDSTSRINMKYELLDSENIVFSFEEEYSLISANTFNNNFSTFFVNGNGNKGRITYSLVGEGAVFLDNGKAEKGNSPTRFTSAEGEVPVENIPTVFETPIETPEDPLDIFDFLVDFPETNNVLNPGDTFINSGGETVQVGLGQTTLGVNYEKLFEEFKEYIEKERNIAKKLRKQHVNQEDSLFYPDEEDIEHLKFKRDKLKQHLNMINNTDTRSRAFVSWARAKLAGTRRSYEMRSHSRLDFYAFNFIDNWIEYLALKEEYDLIKIGSGDG